MTIWQHNCDDVNLNHDQMIELHKDGFLKLSIIPPLETQIERLANKDLKKITSWYELTSRHVIALGVLGVSVYFGINDSLGWLVIGLVAVIIAVLGISGKTEKLLDLAMRDAEFFNRVRDLKGWIFHIEEDKEKEYLVHQAGKDVHDENKKPKYNFVREIKYKKYWYGLDERGASKELIKIFKNLGYKIELSRTSNEKGIDLILDKKIVVRKNTKEKKVRGLDLQKFWESWKDTHNSGIFISINGFNSNCKYFAVGKQILLYELEDLVKIVDGKTPEIEMLNIFEQERKEIEKAKNAKRNPEFQGEPSISLLTQLREFYKDSSVHKKSNYDINNKIISLEMSKRKKVLRTFTREELLNNNSITIRGGGFESVTRYSVGLCTPDKAMQGVVIQGIREPVLLGNHDGSEATIKPTGYSRLKKAGNKSRLRKALEDKDYLGNDWSVEAKKHNGDDGIEDINTKRSSSKPYKYEEVVNVKKDLSAVDYLSD